MSCRQSRRSNEMDSVNCATSAAGPPANRPLRETGEVFFMRFARAECAPVRPRKSLRKKHCPPAAAYGIVAAEAMSEFKFACPVCGQHITADSSTSGGQIECPTCFQKILVPQAPATQDTKFILSAAQVGKPRPTSTDAAAQLGPLRTSSPRLLYFRDDCVARRAVRRRGGPISSSATAFSNPHTAPASARHKRALVCNRPGRAQHQLSDPHELHLDVGPDERGYSRKRPLRARIHDSGFLCEKAILRGGYLSLNQGEHWPWDLAIAVEPLRAPGRGVERQDRRDWTGAASRPARHPAMEGRRATARRRTLRPRLLP